MCKTKTKEIPFDINRIDEEGIIIRTKCGHNVRIVDIAEKGSAPITALIDYGEYYSAKQYTMDGYEENMLNDKLDLVMKVPVKKRRMTYREISWWLRDKPEEHHEWKCESGTQIYSYMEYNTLSENEPIEDTVRIRSNGGEWREPLIEE